MNHIPVFNSHVIKQVVGRHNAFKATLAQIGSDWKPTGGPGREISADVIAVGYSLMPSVELTRLAGCEHHFDETLGYWRVSRSKRIETTVPGVFVAGDGVQIKGYEAAVIEGRLAAIETACQLNSLRKTWYNGIDHLRKS